MTDKKVTKALYNKLKEVINLNTQINEQNIKLVENQLETNDAEDIDFDYLYSENDFDSLDFQYI